MNSKYERISTSEAKCMTCVGQGTVTKEFYDRWVYGPGRLNGL